MAIDFEPNILRVTKKFGFSFMPEKSDWNPTGITEQEAKVIAQRHNFKLEIRSSDYVSDLRVFKFEDEFIKRINPEGGEKAETINN